LYDRIKELEQQVESYRELMRNEHVGARF
jgi:hypothetical protein